MHGGFHRQITRGRSGFLLGAKKRTPLTIIIRSVRTTGWLGVRLERLIGYLVLFRLFLLKNFSFYVFNSVLTTIKS